VLFIRRGGDLLEQQIGKITHYFSNIGVAVVVLSANIKAGELVHIKGRETDFKQLVESMQINHKELMRAEKGQEIGLKVDSAVKEGDIIYAL
jgi:putative protease